MPFPNYRSARQTDPDQYVRKRYAKNKGGRGVDFIYGFKKGGGSEVQSVRFNKEIFTSAQAKKWLKDHDFKTSLEAIEDNNPMAADTLKAYEPSFEEIHNLIDQAIARQFPVPGDEHARRFWIDKVWSDKVLLQRCHYNGLNSDPKWALASYTVSQDENGTSSVELGDLVPVQIQAVPKDGGDGVVLDEAGRRNANADASKVNQAIRALLSVLNEEDLEEETVGLINSMLMAPVKEGELDLSETNKKSMGKGGQKEPDADLAEAWASLPGKTFTENFNWLEEAEVDRGGLVIRNTVVLGPVSANGRRYPVETQKKAISLFEGIKAYLNHPRSNEMSEPRDVEDLIGEHKNVRVVGDKTLSDLHLVDTPLVRDYVLPIAESKPHLCGNSIVARGKMSKSDEGYDVVEEILAARSVDLVAEPATTKGLFLEGKTFSKENGEMEIKDLTLDVLRKDRPDLVESILASVKEQEKFRIVEAHVTQLEADLTKSKEALTERDTKITEYEIRDARRVKETLVEKFVREAQIPDSVKYEAKNGQKQIKPHFRSVLEKFDAEEDMKKVVSEWEEVYRQAPVVSDEKRLFESKSNGDLGRLYNALVS